MTYWKVIALAAAGLCAGGIGIGVATAGPPTYQSHHWNVTGLDAEETPTDAHWKPYSGRRPVDRVAVWGNDRGNGSETFAYTSGDSWLHHPRELEKVDPWDNLPVTRVTPALSQHSNSAR